MKTYVFPVELEEDEDGRWSATIEVLAGCSAWGYTREEALNALREAAQSYLEVLREDGRPLPKEAEQQARVIPAPAVAVTLCFPVACEAQ